MSNFLSKVVTFAGDKKIDGKVICSKDYDNIHYDLNKLIDWSEVANVFNTDTCICLKIRNFKYKMREQDLDNVKQENSWCN